MNKNGFTLAEVLISITIAGVIAALTLPALNADTREKRIVTTFQKTMNVINTAVSINMAEDNFDFSSVDKHDLPTLDNIYDSSGDVEQSVWGILATKAQVDRAASVNPAKRISTGNCKSTTKSQIHFNDGVILCYRQDITDGGIRAIIDVNGTKGPNELSTCDDAECKSGKNIKDQFLITLVDSSALPGRVKKEEKQYTISSTSKTKSNAAVWAMAQHN